MYVLCCKDGNPPKQWSIQEFDQKVILTCNDLIIELRWSRHTPFTSPSQELTVCHNFEFHENSGRQKKSLTTFLPYLREADEIQMELLVNQSKREQVFKEKKSYFSLLIF